ncbi:hypothetical protein BGX28_000444 [Mortierella sp. GBA30]|nr:hypothetical protein BGX28_000444 [Mortierella sp. GBA30]
MDLNLSKSKWLPVIRGQHLPKPLLKHYSAKHEKVSTEDMRHLETTDPTVVLEDHAHPLQKRVGQIRYKYLSVPNECRYQIRHILVLPVLMMTPGMTIHQRY